VTGVATPIDAATVVVLRPARRRRGRAAAGGATAGRAAAGFEALLTVRPSTMVFGPGIAVFPGGRVDAADRVAVAGADDPLAAHRAAAVREAREEVGLDLDPDALVPLSRWVTPPPSERRFDVRFFGALLPPGARVRRHRGEVDSVAWRTPRAGLRAMAAGRLALWQPTAVTLQQLDGLASLDDLRRAFAPSAGPAPSRTRVGRAVDGVASIDGTWAGGIAGRRWSGWLVGRRSLVVVDPGDPTDETMALVAATVAARGGRLAGVALTSLAPERHAGVEMFRTTLDLPVAAGPGARRLTSYSVAEVEDGGRVPFGDIGLRAERGRATGGPVAIDLVLDDGRRLAADR
jgi:8-oxo-dGTP pyrophosphatase MutT (NUDIX family)